MYVYQKTLSWTHQKRASRTTEGSQRSCICNTPFTLILSLPPFALQLCYVGGTSQPLESLTYGSLMQ